MLSLILTGCISGLGISERGGSTIGGDFTSITFDGRAAGYVT
jgi:hypothetical protein